MDNVERRGPCEMPGVDSKKNLLGKGDDDS